MGRSRRILLLGAAIALACIVAVVAVVVLGRGSGTNAATATPATGITATRTTATQTTATESTATTPTRADGPAAIAALFAGIPQHGDTLGDPGAAATMIVFEDPQCPFCAEWSIATLPTVLTRFVRTGKLKLVYRGILIIGPNSGVGLRAIVAAGRQNKLWNMNEALYANQGAENSGWITPNLVLALASDLGIDGKKLLADANSKAVTSELEAAAREATADKVQGTPSFEIVNPPAVPKPLNVTSLEPDGFIASLTAALG
jgi:protein-disulfide isomerase